MQHPTWLDELPDGLYGSVDALISSLESGEELKAWERQRADNALCEVKIRQWLHSDSYAERHGQA